MKIAIVAPSPVPYTVGGAEKLWWGMVDAFRAHTNHEVELVKVPTRERNMRELLDSYRYWSQLDLNHFDLVISTKYPAWMVWHDNHWVYLQHRLRGLYDTYPAGMPEQPFDGDWPPELQRLRRALSAEPGQPHREELFAALYELADILPAANWERWFALPSPLARAVIHWLDDSALRPGMIRKYMAISQTVAGRRDYFPPGVPVQVIHHPSDLAPADPGGHRYFFTASRLDGPKRLDLLVRAFMASEARQWLLIAGSGPQADALRSLASGDGRVRFLGRVSDAELRRYYAGALCVPFVPADEDLGLITVEAFQAGKPVLTLADAGGVPELVEEGKTGWIAEPTLDALTAAIDRIAAAPEQAVAMAGACRERGNAINWASTLGQILDDSFALDAYGNRELGKPSSLLVPLTFPVWPPRSGGQNRIFHLYRRIARYVPVTLLTLGPAGEPGLDAEIAPGLREWRIPRATAHQASERQLERELGASVADLYAIDHAGDTPEFVSALRACCDAAGLVIASHPYLYRAIRAVYRGPVYYEAHNAEYDMKRDVLGDEEAAQPWLELARAVEGECASDAIGLSACSAEDRDRLGVLYEVPPARIAVVPNGVAAAEIPVIDPGIRRRVARRMLQDYRAAAVFVGAWHGPNIEAVQWLMEDLAPQCPDLQFWVVGSVCHFWENRGNKIPPGNVTLLGQLDESDKNAVLSCAQVALNPVVSGSGSNLKMAEYAVAGLPVLSTPFGCRGLELTGLPTVRQAELDGFAAELATLVGEVLEGRLDQGEPQARRALLAACDWNGIGDVYFAHLVSSYREHAYNRRHAEGGVYPEVSAG